MRLSILLIAAAALMAQDAPPKAKVRAKLQPESGIIAGQPVYLVVDVLSNTWFASAPDFPEISVPGAVVLPPEEMGTNFSEQGEGGNWAGQEKRYVIFPMTAGEFEVPAVAVSAQPADPSGKTSPAVVLTTPPLRFTAELPQQAREAGLRSILSAQSLSVTEKWSRQDWKSLKLGDAVDRHIVFEVTGSIAMAIPPVSFEGPEGVSVYPGQPEVADHVERGSYSGKRTETASYVFGREGPVSIPPITVYWWDLNAHTLHKVVLPGFETTILPNPDLDPSQLRKFAEQQAPAAETAKRSIDPKQIAYIVILLLVLAVSWRFLRPYVQAIVARRKATEARRADAEAVWFSKFESAAQGGDAAKTRAAIYAWLDRWGRYKPAATLLAFGEEAGDPQLREELASLQSSKPPALADLRFRAIAARKTLMAGRDGASRPVLPPLNP
ncbi:MAG: BatD family protein [Acidobacteria bacterium]|nr:BatD family protein [Acidobacteriota bacterium]